jgi:hypothetical protein
MAYAGKSTRPYLKSKLTAKELGGGGRGEKFRWQSTCLASLRPSIQSPLPPKNKEIVI